MKLLGINFLKISAERDKEFKTSNVDIKVNFIDIEKDKLEILRDTEILKVYFKYNISYKESPSPSVKPNAEINYEGIVLLSVEKHESKEILKYWKKKEIPIQYKTPIFNMILKKCSIRSLSLEEDLNLPFHIPLPKVNG